MVSWMYLSSRELPLLLREEGLASLLLGVERAQEVQRLVQAQVQVLAAQVGLVLERVALAVEPAQVRAVDYILERF
jgi:hypothetical protein